MKRSRAKRTRTGEDGVTPEDNGVEQTAPRVENDTDDTTNSVMQPTEETPTEEVPAEDADDAAVEQPLQPVVDEPTPTEPDHAASGPTEQTLDEPTPAEPSPSASSPAEPVQSRRGRRRRAERESQPEHPEAKYFRVTVWAFVGMFVLLGIAAAAAFLIALRPAEQTQVPTVTGQELVQSVIDLQERGLVPFVQLRYFSDPLLKGRVVSQEPAPGTTVRVGRRINLVVSQGAVLEEVGDYVGRPLSDVQTELQALFSSFDQLLSIGNVSYVFNDQAAGTVIEQRPEPGTDIVGPTPLTLVVSRGPEVARTALPTYLGLSWEDALTILARDNVPFVFKLVSQPPIGPDGVVVGQTPAPQTEVTVGSPVELTIRDVRSVPRDHRFGIFDRTLPEYAVRVGLTAVVLGPEGEPRTVFSMQHPGGRIAFPYVLPIGSTIVLYRFDAEVVRVVIRDNATE